MSHYWKNIPLNTRVVYSQYYFDKHIDIVEDLKLDRVGTLVSLDIGIDTTWPEIRWDDAFSTINMSVNPCDVVVKEDGMNSVERKYYRLNMLKKEKSNLLSKIDAIDIRVNDIIDDLVEIVLGS